MNFDKANNIVNNQPIIFNVINLTYNYNMDLFDK